MRSKSISMALAVALLAVAALPAHAILPIQQWQTSSGARVYFVENHELPMLDISVEFPALLSKQTNRQITTMCNSINVFENS